MKDYPPYLDYPKPKKPQTNGDKIRAMTDEALANKFSLRCCPVKDAFYDCKKWSEDDCRQCWIEWLKQEATDD